MIVLGVIPARYGSSRFPGKPLADLQGKPMVQWVYERSKASKYLQDVIIATDDEKIFQVVKEFSGSAMMTDKNHPTGTDRLREVSARFPADIYVNIQGDEPLIRSEMIDQVVFPLLQDIHIEVGTLATRVENPGELIDPNVVKVVLDKYQYALYFSRSVIPFYRETKNPNDWIRFHPYWKHIGIYAYRRQFLQQFPELSQSVLEQSEKLEQLRILENGFKIKVSITQYHSIGVDTPDDLERIKQLLTHDK